MAELASHLHRAYFPARIETARDPLLLLNSLATTTEIWRPILPRLTAVTNVLCVDYPGHGQSPARELPTDLDTLTSQIVDAMDIFGVDRVHVAGVSVGGMAALRLAETVPDRIASITVIGSTPVMDRDMWLARKEVVQQWGTRGLIPDVIPRWFTPEYAASSPATVSAYSRMLESTVDSAYAAFCDLLAGADLRPGLENIQRPTVVVSGGRDLAATVEQGQLIAARVPGARHEVIEEAAHMVQAMAPDRVAQEIIGSIVAAH